MENFSFCNPTQIEFGKDKEKNIGKYISQNGVKKFYQFMEAKELQKMDFLMQL